ncbi:Helix-turn-helix domain-containing protein [Actinokineospora alba]|uniref:Helix-turn-helix domain-containing protein n=1 Tax=Actinokineospora alba TaxID=504798 RepID=A0A1H0LQE0_9PSEU|nr:helix-turn-helix transcriptional regulator [Actinokineospora alba]TDP67412.1 helix-turn-helix protein [Actinokineospora alba]SDI97396.1 Helix-turn-helix domain-containing protein [Actinokineospora alba]SDO70408.1 Helix-turn-helix domain-containing protein [Actinokineospora alba]
MTNAQRRHEFAQYLTWLKQRSGRTYEQLGRATNMGKSTVHRYCGGVCFPAVFGTAEQIALACSASQEELSKLYRLWERSNSAVETVVRAPVPPRRKRFSWLAAALATTVLVGIVSDPIGWTRRS